MSSVFFSPFFSNALQSYPNFLFIYLFLELGRFSCLLNKTGENVLYFLVVVVIVPFLFPTTSRSAICSCYEILSLLN